MKKSKSVLRHRVHTLFPILIAVVAICTFGILFINPWKNQFSQQIVTQMTPAPTTTMRPISTPLWNTFRDKRIGVQFDYPTDTSLNQVTDDRDGLDIIFTKKGLDVFVGIYPLKNALPENTYEDTGKTVQTGEYTWRLFQPQCSPSATGCGIAWIYQTTVGNYQVNYFFQGYPPSSDAFLKQLLSSVKPTD